MLGRCYGGGRHGYGESYLRPFPKLARDFRIPAEQQHALCTMASRSPVLSEA
jgi:hypothetical protein